MGRTRLIHDTVSQLLYGSFSCDRMSRASFTSCVVAASLHVGNEAEVVVLHSEASSLPMSVALAFEARVEELEEDAL